MTEIEAVSTITEILNGFLELISNGIIHRYNFILF
jgi:hypothetical protein